MKNYSRGASIEDDLDSIFEELGKLNDRVTNPTQLDSTPNNDAFIRLGETNGVKELHVKIGNDWYKLTGLTKVD